MKQNMQSAYKMQNRNKKEFYQFYECRCGYFGSGRCISFDGAVHAAVSDQRMVLNYPSPLTAAKNQQTLQYSSISSSYAPDGPNTRILSQS